MQQESEDSIDPNLVACTEKSAASSRPLNIDLINELELQADVKNVEDLQELSKILQDILDYPLTENAQIHHQAMKLGNFDLEKDELSAKQRLDTTNELLQEGKGTKQQICRCCGFVKQQDSIKLCTPLNQIKNMGLSTYLFFSTFKNLSLLLLIMTIVYSIFALITNIIASQVLSETTGVSVSSLDYISISLSSKQQNPSQTNKLYYFISCWLGLGMIILWMLALVGIKYKETKDSQQYDSDTISCSDYSISIEGLPIDVTQEQLQAQFNQFYTQTIRNNDLLPSVWKEPLNIAKINIGKPFYLTDNQLSDEELEKINQDLAQIKQNLIDWIKERQSQPSFQRPKADRQAVYGNYAKLSARKRQKLVELSEKIRTILRNESSHDITTVFITFEINNSKTVIDHIHQTGLLGRIRALCSDSFKRFTFKRGDHEFSLKIQRAPEPQDIIWQNIGHKDCATYGRKFLTYTVTLVLLGISFAIVFGLTKAQQSSNDNRVLSIAISLTIAVVNVLLGLIIKFLTYYEKDYTATNREASLAVKSIMAQMINTIIIPVITAYQIKNNVYSTSGLVDNIFLLGITTSFVPPILVLVDPYNLFMKVMRCIKSRPSSKLSQTQKEHNLLHEGIEFQLGYHYIYIANVFLFTCFFVSLQPIVALFAIVGYFLMYWAQKYCMFNRYRRPVPSTDFVNNAVHRMIMLGPLTYSFGSLTWSNLAPNGFPEEALLPNLICIGLSAVLVFIPIHSIVFGACFQNQYDRIKKYADERLMFPSEYDRLNPTTQQEGIAEFKKYMEKKMEELKGASSQKKAEILQLLGKNAQRSHQINQGGMNQQLGGALGSLFGAGPQQGFSQANGMQGMPMQAMFPGLFPGANQPMASAFPFMMMGQPQPMVQHPQQHPPVRHHQPRQAHMSPAPQVNPYPSMSNPPNPMAAMMQPQPQANPLALLNLGNQNGQSRGQYNGMNIPRGNNYQGR